MKIKKENKIKALKGGDASKVQTRRRGPMQAKTQETKV